MGNKISIFNTRGGVSFTTTTTKQDAFITFTSPYDFSDVLYTKAPLTGVQMVQGVDYNILKALGQDFCISSFGDKPVTITLSGLSVYGTACGTSRNKQSIMEFYDKHKISKSSGSRVQIGVATGMGAALSFKCVILALHVETTAEQAITGMYSYKMTLVGVRA